PPPPPPKPPIFSITSPTDGQVFTVSGDTSDVTITLTTQNLILKQPSGAAKKGEGNFQITVDSGTPVTVASKSYTITPLPVGSHKVKVELMNNDKTSYIGVSPKTVTFTIEKEKPKEYVPKTYTVKLKDFSYDPATLTAKVGDSIVFENDGSFPRDATCFV